MGIDDESSHPELCSEVADGVTRTIVCLFREPDAGKLPVRFDEREQETGPSQTGLRWRGESQVDLPPGDYSYCACSRLYSITLALRPTLFAYVLPPTARVPECHLPRRVNVGLLAFST